GPALFSYRGPATSVTHPDASPEARAEGVEIDRVGRIVRSAAAAAARGDGRIGVEDVVDRSEQLDIPVAACADRNLVRHRKPVVAHSIASVGGGRYVDSRIISPGLLTSAVGPSVALSYMTPC